MSFYLIGDFFVYLLSLLNFIKPIKTVISFFISCFIVLSTYAQTDFQKHFDFPSFDVLSDMILTSDNNLLLCGYTSYGILFIKTDLNGEVI